jgi:tellurite resistance protein TehA-like permease
VSLTRSRPRLAGLRASQLHPISHAMVMGTGSLSSGALLLGWSRLSTVLFAIATIAFVLLVSLTVARVLRYPDHVRADAANPRTAFAPYTLAAAIAILGVRAALDGHTVLPAIALVLGTIMNAALAVPAVGVLRSQRGRADAVTGNWQLPSVAIEALALLAASLGLRLRSNGFEATAVALWLIGVPVYAAVVPAIIRRFRRVPFGPADLTPDYWTLMAVPSLIGLVATRLWAASPHLAAASWLRPILEPIAFAGLGISAALAPAWITLQVWRLLRDPGSRRYQPTWWGLVFPTAIVVVAAQVAGTVYGVGWLHPAAVIGYWLVFAAWATVGLGLVRNLGRRELEAA